jgi:heat-inducible transcriptional repressor
MKSATQKKNLPTKKLPKTDREQAVLLGLIELYLKTGKPIGSSTLQESGFESLSSATIRNYFSKMEEAGYLKQQHTSGGRIPTDKAFRLYADAMQNEGVVEKPQEEKLDAMLEISSKEPVALLHRLSDALSEMTQCAVFATTPRFDHDFIQDVKLIRLSKSQLLSVLITDFGLVRTETVYLDREIDPTFLHSVEEYFLWRLNKGEKPFFQDEKEAKIAQRIYNEVMVRHVVGYANFPEEDVLRTGLARLLAYPEFNDAAALAHSLSLLESDSQMRTLLRECAKREAMTSWIGNELAPFVPKDAECTVIAIPYRINQTVAGAIAILGPMRISYRNAFGLLQTFSEKLSRALTSSLYKYKVTFRQPTHSAKQIEVQ